MIGALFTAEPAVWFMTYGALLLDLLIVFLLLHRRTRVFAFLAAVAFHLMNARLFTIGIFPWLMIAATVLFFPPDWPRRVISDLRQVEHRPTKRLFGLGAGAVLGFWLGGFLPEIFSLWPACITALGLGVAGYHLALLVQPYRSGMDRPRKGRGRADRNQRRPATVPIAAVTLTLLLAWVGTQVLWPLRHFVIPGNVHWTEEGHNFAWHMKLRQKDATARFFITADGQTFEVINDVYLTERQQQSMSSRPHMILQYAHFLEDEYEAQGNEFVAVRAVVWASLNGREPQLLIDPEFDLTTAGYPWIGHAEWILPLSRPPSGGN